MTRIPGIRALFRLPASRQRVAREVDEEIAFHLEERARALVEQGLDPQAARERALGEFGSVAEATVELEDIDMRRVRRSSRAEWWSQLPGDIRHAARMFRRNPTFSAVVVLTLALGISATTTIFSIADGVLLRPLPYPESGRLVQLGETEDDARLQAMSPLDFYDLQRLVRTFEAVAASRIQFLDFMGSGEPERFWAAGVSASFFDVLGVHPAVGRAFRVEDDRPGTDAVVILSHGLWRRRFGADPSIIGRTMILGDLPRTVIGVMPAGFHPPEAIAQGETDLWLPLGQIDDELTGRDSGFLQVIGRLRGGVTVDAARADLAAAARTIDEQNPDSDPSSYGLRGLRHQTVGDVGGRLYVLLGAVGFLLLIACANVANLFLVRATERARELALRAALGATRRRLVRQLLTESAVIAVVSGAIGVLLAWAGVRAFIHLSPGDIPRLAEVRVDARVLLFGLALSLLTGVLFGLAPALSGVVRGSARALRDGGHGSTVGRRGSGVRGALVIAQVATALMLLTGASLLVNSFVRLSRVAPGFDATNVLWVKVALPRDLEPESADGYWQDLFDRVGGIPGVSASGAIHGLPLDGNESTTNVLPEGLTLVDDQEGPSVAWHSVAPGYFATLGIDVHVGQDFTAADRADSPPVAIVSEAFVHRFWPAERRVIGKRIRLRDQTEATVVGVVADVHHYGLGTAVEPMMYRPLAQYPRSNVTVVARHDRRDDAAVIRAVREAIWTAQPGLPLDEFGTMRDHVSRSIVQPRFYAALLGGFAAIALALAVVGLYGSLAYTVRLRSREIGIRIALGAAGGDVTRMVVRQGMGLALGGVLLGCLGALGGTRALRSFVFGVTPTDAPTFTIVAAAMILVALLACWIPARRAAATDPMRTLGAE